MVFEILKTDALSRNGRLVLNASISTPMMLTFTSIGSVPHVSPTLFSDIQPFNDKLPLLVALQDFVFLTTETLFPKKDHRIFKKPKLEAKGEFINLKDYLRLSDNTLVIGDLRDIYDQLHVHQDLEVTDEFAKVYTSRGGVGQISAHSYARSVVQLKPDLVISMADANDPKGQGNVKKRLKKSLARTIKFLECLVEKVNETQSCIPIFATCVGGDDLEMRSECSRVLGSRADVDGYVVPLNQSSTIDYKSRLSSSLESLPFDKPRVVYGLTNFSQILFAISQGVDLFDGLIPYICTTKGIGLDLKFNSKDCRCIYINLNDVSFALDSTPIDSSCSCFTCKNHTRAYIHHLLKSKEMLAGVLLITHNIFSSNRFMQDVGTSIENGTFRRDSSEFERIGQDISFGLGTDLK